MTDRRRTYSWSDPVALAAAAGDRDGLQFLTDISAGLLPAPPSMATLAVGADGRLLAHATSTCMILRPAAPSTGAIPAPEGAGPAT